MHQRIRKEKAEKIIAFAQIQSITEGKIDDYEATRILGIAYKKMLQLTKKTRIPNTCKKKTP